MQPLGQTTDTGTVYTDAQVQAQLLAPVVRLDWAFDRLDRSGVLLGDLTPQIIRSSPPVVTHDSTAVVKRTLKLTLRGDTVINPWQDLIRVRALMRMPAGDSVGWSLGIFLLNPPSKEIRAGRTIWVLDGVDLAQLLIDDKFQAAYTVAAGTPYLTAIQTLITAYTGPYRFQSYIPGLTAVLPAALSWKAGDPRLTAINDLLAAVNYQTLWPDENGMLRSSAIQDFTLARPSFVFDTTTGLANLVKQPIVESIDPSRAFNIAIVGCEDPRRGAFTQVYTNSRADSPVSTVNWRPKAEAFFDSKLPDPATALIRGRNECQKAARVYTATALRSFPWALSQNEDVYQVNYVTPDEGTQMSLYLETKWTHECSAGGDTIHDLERLVPA